MAKNKNIKKSKPKIDLNSNESKPKIEKENIEVSRNIQVDTSSKGTKSAGDLNIVNLILINFLLFLQTIF